MHTDNKSKEAFAKRYYRSEPVSKPVFESPLKHVKDFNFPNIPTLVLFLFALVVLVCNNLLFIRVFLRFDENYK